MQPPLFSRGAEGGHAACRRRGFRGRAARGGLWDYLQVGVRARVLLWGVPFAASEPQRPDDLVCRVQRRRLGACLAWGRKFCHCCVAVPKSRGWGADFLWLVHVLWARWGVGGGANAGSAGRRLRARVGIRCSPCRPCGMGGPIPSGVGGQVLSLPRLPSFWGAAGVRHSRAVGADARAWGPSTVPFACMLCGGPRAVGVVGGRPGGWPSTAARGVWCQALSLPLLPVLLGGGRPGFRDPCVPGAVGVGVGTKHRPHSVCPCGLSLRAAGVVKGRPPGRLPCTATRGV